MAFDISAISDFIDERTSPFLMAAFRESKTLRHLTPWAGLKNETKIPINDMDYDLLQDGDDSCAFNAKGDIVTTQRSLDPQRIKFETEFCVKDLERKFFGMAMPKGSMYDSLEPKEAMFMEVIRKAVAESLEISIWQGEKGGSSGAASLNLYDGILHQIDNAIAATEIPLGQQVATGAITSANAITALEDMRDALPGELYDSVTNDTDWIYWLSGDVQQKYFQNYRSSFTALPFNQAFVKPAVDGTVAELTNFPGLTKTVSTNKIILARKSNMWYGFDAEGEELDFEVGMDQYNKKIWVRSEFKIAFNVGQAEQIVVNNF